MWTKEGGGMSVCSTGTYKMKKRGVPACPFHIQKKLLLPFSGSDCVEGPRFGGSSLKVSLVRSHLTETSY